MRKIRTMLLALGAGALLFGTSCKEETYFGDGTVPTNEKASLNIKLTGDDLTTRASAASDDEMAIKKFSIYVFYANGPLEKEVTGGEYTAPQEINGLTTGNKIVAVITNAPSGFDPSSITSFSQFKDVAFELGTQYEDIDEYGLTMSGTEGKVLAGGSNAVEVKVSRLVAKIELGSITIDPNEVEPGHDANKLEVEAVHMMKVKSQAKLGSPNVLGNIDLYGGVNATEIGDKVIVSKYRDYLTASAKKGDNNAYFYVFPNSGGDDATLMTIEGKYDGVTTYFPFVINETAIDGESGTGNYIQRNTLHSISVIIKKPGAGVDHPETLVDPATLKVTITPEDWVIIPGQTVEW